MAEDDPAEFYPRWDTKSRKDLSRVLDTLSRDRPAIRLGAGGVSGSDSRHTTESGIGEVVERIMSLDLTKVPVADLMAYREAIYKDWGDLCDVPRAYRDPETLNTEDLKRSITGVFIATGDELFSFLSRSWSYSHSDARRVYNALREKFSEGVTGQC